MNQNNGRNSKRQRGTGSVFLRGSTWWIKFYQPGSMKPVRESSKSTNRRDAERLLRERTAQVQLRQYKGPQVEKVTFEDLVKLIESDYEAAKHRSARALQDSIRNLRSFFGGYRASEIDYAAFEQYKMHRLKAGAADATIKKERAALMRMFSLARQSSKVEKVPKFRRIDVYNVRENFFEDHEVRTVIRNLPAILRPMVEFAYLTGWRRQEVLGLRWTEINFDDSAIRLQSSRSKNKEIREYPFSAHPRLKELLRTQRKYTSHVEKAQTKMIPWVFHRNGKRIKEFKNAWHKACEKAGVAGYWFHDLRRSASRNLIRSGVSETVAMKLTGHKTRSIFERYAIVDRTMLDEAVAKVAEHHERDVSQKGKVVNIGDRRPTPSEEE